MSGPYKDLLKDTSESFENGNYFLVTILDLDLSKQYPLQFRWKYKDGTYGKDWSARRYITTPGSTLPGDPAFAASDAEGGAGFFKVTWNGKDSSNNTITNIDRVDVHVSGAPFGDGTKPTDSFKEAGTKTFTAPAGVYIVQLKAVRVDGTTSFFSSARTVTVTEVGEPIENPISPAGFSARSILGGVEVTWNGGYAGGATWSGFGAINIYAGTTAAATSGTYTKVGQMTGNKVENKIVIPIDGTYVKYGSVAYLHASSVNKATPPVESSIVANVASATPSQVVNTDLIDQAVTEIKIALNAVTETKIADDAITTPKIITGAITAGKIGALQITSEKIAAGAIVAGKIDANAITADLINSGTLKASTYIRVGTKNPITGAGARIEIASNNVEDGDVDVVSGFHIYNSAGTAILSAPLTGGLTINGGGTFSGNLSAAGGTFTGALNIGTISGGLYPFSVSSSGVLRAISGTVGGITLAADGLQNTGGNFKLDSSGKARFGETTNSIIINPSSTAGALTIFHSTDGSSSSGTFSVSNTGLVTMVGASFKGTITNDTSSDYWNNDGSFRFGGANGITRGSGATAPVSIGGNVTISGSLTAAAIGIDSENYWNNTGNAGKFRVGGSSKYVYWNGSTIDINGKVTADSGQIGPWVINPSGYLSDSGETVKLLPSGTVGSSTYTLLTNKAILAKEMQLGAISQTGGPGNGYLLIDGSSNGLSYALSVSGETVLDNLLCDAISASNISGYSLDVSGGIASRTGIPGSYTPALGVTNNAPSTAQSTYPHYVVVTSQGNLREYYSSSSIKYKENVSYMDEEYLYSVVTNLNPVTFNFKQEFLSQEDEYGVKQWGLIAEEVNELDTVGDLIGFKNNEPDTVRYEILPTYIIGAMKSMAKKIKDLQDRLDAIEG